MEKSNPTSPAEELRAAATLIRETASNATPGPWTVSRLPGIGRTVNDPTARLSIAVGTGWVSGADGEWIALMSPDLAEPLGDLLRSIAAVHEQPPCDAPEACNRCAEPDPVIIDALRVIEVLWAQAHAATITREIDADPAAKLKATGLMRHEPKPVPRDDRGRVIPPPGPIEFDPGPVSATLYQDNGLPMVWSDLDPPGSYVCAVYETAGGPGIDMPDGTRICGMPVESEPCGEHGQRDDDLTAPGVADSRAQIAPHLPPPVPHDPAGVPVATSGPTVTMPDTGLNPDPLPPAPPTAEPRHAKPDRPGLLARLTGGHRTINDEQDGDA